MLSKGARPSYDRPTQFHVRSAGESSGPFDVLLLRREFVDSQNGNSSMSDSLGALTCLFGRRPLLMVHRRTSCIIHRHHDCAQTRRDAAARAAALRTAGTNGQKLFFGGGGSRTKPKSSRSKPKPQQTSARPNKKSAPPSAGGRIQQCPHCRQQFQDPVELVAHVEAHENFQQKQRTQQQQQQTGGSSEAFQCPQCPGSRFRDAAAVVRHFDAVHASTTEGETQHTSQQSNSGCCIS